MTDLFCQKCFAAQHCNDSVNEGERKICNKVGGKVHNELAGNGNESIAANTIMFILNASY